MQTQKPSPLRHLQQLSQKPHNQEGPQVHRLRSFHHLRPHPPGTQLQRRSLGQRGPLLRVLTGGNRIKLVVQAQSQPDNHRQHPTSHRNLRATRSSGRSGVVATKTYRNSRRGESFSSDRCAREKVNQIAGDDDARLGVDRCGQHMAIPFVRQDETGDKVLIPGNECI